MASPTNNNDGSDVTDTTGKPLVDQEEPLSGKHGWANISTIVRQVDAEKIDGCNQDLDAILTFSGIYSAALTAFLAESYKDLQPDPQAAMIFLLQQLVIQTNSFTINDRFINSTLSRPMLAPDPIFTPPSSAKQINGLWFASLALSLVCASCTILVKQWLREFIPTEQSSPRRYLRIRHFRLPGLTFYRVFEIAAILPFLIQISLLLFLSGLCIFTAGVWKGIEDTTLSIIAAWAFFLLATAFIPSVDPTCPYKVPILQMLSAAPKKLSQLWIERGKESQDPAPPTEPAQATQGGRGTLDSLQFGSSVGKVPIIQMVLAVLKRLFGLKHSQGEQRTDSPDAVPTIETSQVHRGDQDIPGSLPLEQPAAVGTLAMITLPSAGLVPSVPGVDSSRPTEKEAAETEIHDVDILVDVLEIDAVQANDEILRDVMCEALLQASIEPKKLLQLPFAVINSRLKHDGGKISPGEDFNMGSLSYQSYTTITYMLALLVEKVAKTQDSKVDSHLPQWLEHSIYALLYHTEHTPLPIVTRALYSCLAKHHQHFFRLVRSSSDSKTTSPNRSISLQSTLKMLQSELAKEKSDLELFKFAVSMMRPIPEDHSAPIVASNSPDIIKDLRCEDNTPIPLDCRQILKDVLKPRIKMNSADFSMKTFARIDAILLDDEFLMQEILAPGRPWHPVTSRTSIASATQLLDLLIEVIRNRLRYEAPAGRILNLAGLDKPVYDMITGLAAQLYNMLHLEPDPSGSISDTAQAASEPDTYDPLREKVACILLSPSGDHTYEHDKHVITALQHLFSRERYKKIAQLIRSQYLTAVQGQAQSDSPHHSDSSPEQSMVLKKLKDGFVSTDSAVDLISFIQTLFPPKTNSAIVSQQEERLQREAGSVLFDANNQIAYDVPVHCLEAVLDLFLSRVLANKVFDKKTWHITYQPLLFETVFHLLSFIEKRSNYWEQVNIFVRDVLSPPDLIRSIDLSPNAETICDIALNTAAYPARARLAAQASFAKAASHVAHHEGLRRILNTLELYRLRLAHKSSETAFTRNSVAAVTVTDLDSCLTFRFYLQLLNNPHPAVHHESHREKWTQLFKSVLPSLVKLAETPGLRLFVDDAEECLELVSQISTTFNMRGLILPYRQKDVVKHLERIQRG